MLCIRTRIFRALRDMWTLECCTGNSVQEMIGMSCASVAGVEGFEFTLELLSRWGRDAFLLCWNGFGPSKVPLCSLDEEAIDVPNLMEVSMKSQVNHCHNPSLLLHSRFIWNSIKKDCFIKYNLQVHCDQKSMAWDWFRSGAPGRTFKNNPGHWFLTSSMHHDLVYKPRKTVVYTNKFLHTATQAWHYLPGRNSLIISYFDDHHLFKPYFLA